MTILLGLDVGTTSVKAGLFDESGRRLATAADEYRIDHPTPDRAELDPETYWSATVTAIRRALAVSGADPAQLAAIAVSSQGETVIPVDAVGRPLGPALVWLDNRAGAEARWLAERFGDAAVYERTGIPSINPTWTACKILWWRRNEPDVFAHARRFLLVEDFILHRLSGRFVTDGAVNCTSLLYDIRDHGWWGPMLEAIGIEPGHLPEIVRPGSVVGTLSPAASRALGLPSTVRVVSGGMDQCTGAVGVGNIDGGVVSESTGGALTLQASVDRHGLDLTGQTPVYVHSAPNRYLYCPVCPTGGMALTWFRDQFGGEEVALAARDGRSAYDLLTELAAQAPPGAEGLTMLPHLMGAFSPEYDPEARGVFYGFTLRHGKPHFVRAVLEAVAFMLRRNLELLAGVGAGASEIRSHGGGARSALWNQIKADVCGLPVVTLQGEDAAVRGDAMLAGVATDTFRDLAEAGAAMIETLGRYEPTVALRPVYDEAYARYLRLFDALRPLFHATG
ncbi:MAG TPA: FGGY family carbohydrate kinase [Candidatus Limnocylindrales bacterium]|jgi:xylulokinase